MQDRRRGFAANPQTKRWTATLHAAKFRNSIFANQESRAKTARRSLHAGKVRMECVEKTCRAATESAAYGKFVSSFRFLELAKGFEPPTL
jgi:hypothetical protein